MSKQRYLSKIQKAYLFECWRKLQLIIYYYVYMLLLSSRNIESMKYIRFKWFSGTLTNNEKDFFHRITVWWMFEYESYKIKIRWILVKG